MAEISIDSLDVGNLATGLNKELLIKILYDFFLVWGDVMVIAGVGVLGLFVVLYLKGYLILDEEK